MRADPRNSWDRGRGGRGGRSGRDAHDDFDAAFPARSAPVALPEPFAVPQGMTAADYVRQRGRIAHAAVLARAATLDDWEANRFVQLWQTAHPAAPCGDILALGRALEERLGMRPDWTHRPSINAWLSGLETALRAAEGDGGLVLDTALDMRDRGLAIPEPYSLVKMVQDEAAQTRAAQTRAAQTRATHAPSAGARTVDPEGAGIDGADTRHADIGDAGLGDAGLDDANIGADFRRRSRRHNPEVVWLN